MANYPLYETSYAKDFRELLDGFSGDVLFRQKEGEGVADYTCDAFRKLAYDLGAALAELGVLDGKVAVIGETSVQWIAAYFAAVCGGSVIVPIDKELPAEEIANILNDSGARALVYSPTFAEVVAGIEPAAPGVGYWVCMEGEGTDGKHPSFDELAAKGAETGHKAYLRREIDPDALTSLLYTSGTTGRSKGVMLSQRNIIECALGGVQLIPYGSPQMSVLPIHHSYEFSVSIIGGILSGATICINDSLRYFMTNLMLYRPANMFVVPAFVEMMYTKLMAALRAEGTEERVNKLIGQGKYEEVYELVKGYFGGRLRQMICGGAPLAPHYPQKFRELGINLLQGYGITECSPLVAVNRDRYYRDGSVGLPVPYNEVAIRGADAEGNGEIWVRGSNVMLGYYNNPEATAEVMDGGWFNTGDIGYIDDDGFLFITGREKNLIVLSNGKNVYPEEIEGYLMRIPYVKEVVVYAPLEDGINEMKLVAEIFADEDWRASHTEDEAYLELERALADLNKELPLYKQVHEFHLRDTEFEKTTKKSIKRFALHSN